MYQDILDLGFRLKSDIMGVYVFYKQIGDNVIGYFEVLKIDTREETYTYYKHWGGSQRAVPISYKTHVAVTKFLRKVGLLKND
jgi:hypothetical protein